MLKHLSLLALLAACSPDGSLQGTLTMGDGSALSPELRLLAQAEPPTTDLTCQVREATPGPAGAFLLEGLCPETTYRLKANEKSLAIEGNATVAGGQKEAPPMALTLWTAPAADGVALLKEGKLKNASPYTDVSSVQLLGTQETILYPRHKPDKATVIDEGTRLILAGDTTLQRLQFQPLIEETQVRNFLDDYTLQPHFYVGVTFASDTAITRAPPVELNPAGVKNVTAGGRSLRYIDHTALAPGHYALMGEGDRKMYVFTFGPQPAQTVSEGTAP